MNRLVAIALVLAVAAAPAYAQRSGGRGFAGRGSSGFSAPAFHGGPSVSSPSHFPSSFSSRAPMGMSRPTPTARPSFYSGNRYPGRYPVGRPVRRGVPFRGAVYGFPSGVSYVGYPYLGAPFYDDGFYGDDPGYDSEAPIPYADATPDPAAYGYTHPPEQPVYESEFPPPAEIARPVALPQAEPEPAAVTTLIFKDGRSPQKIRNYIATRSTITVIEGQRHHDIPVGDLDIAATMKANRESGSGFQLPAAR